MGAMKRWGRNRAASMLVTILGLVSLNGELAAQPPKELTFYNRTPFDIWVATATYRPAGDNIVLGTNPDSGTAGKYWPHSIETRGWYKINRYGGSATVKCTHVFVDGSEGHKLKTVFQGSKEFPLKRSGTFYFKKEFDQDQKKNPWEKGTLRQEAIRQQMEMQTFAPVNSFPKGELTVDLFKTGESATGNTQSGQTGGAQTGQQVVNAPKRSVWQYTGGSFRDEGNGNWVERNARDTWRFRETQRTAEYIELYDSSRGYSVRLRGDTNWIKGGNERVRKFPDWTQLGRGTWSQPVLK